MDNLSDKRILIVDDIPENLQVLGNLLSDLKLKTYVALSGRQAINIATQNDVDLILLDISMPEMDGFEVCTELKQNEKTKEIPVIFLTARTESEDIVRGFELGAVDYVTKPFKGAELMKRVDNQLKLKASQEIIRKQNEELKKLNRNKDKFFSIIAHDLTNPFSTILGFADLLVDRHWEYSAEKLDKQLNTLNNAAKQAYNLLQKLLEWSRSQNGRLRFNPVEVSLNEVIQKIINSHSSQAEKKNIALCENLVFNPIVEVDVDMFNTVLRNLISNAIKFTPKGGTVCVLTEIKDKNIAIEVTDTGVGMTQEQISNLFRIETHQSTQGTEKETGTGLGLLLCKEFVEMHKGTITVESIENEVTSFIVTLPKNAD